MSDIGLPNGAFAALLGHLLARWGLAETCLIAPLQLTGTNMEAAAAILASANSTEIRIALVQRAIAASPDLTPVQVEAIGSACRRFAKLCPVRNALAHHMWVTDKDTGEAATLDYRKADGKRLTVWKPQRIVELCGDIASIARDLCVASNVEWVGAADIKALEVQIDPM